MRLPASQWRLFVNPQRDVSLSVCNYLGKPSSSLTYLLQGNAEAWSTSWLCLRVSS